MLALRAAGRVGSSKNNDNTAVAEALGHQVGPGTTFSGALGRQVDSGTTVLVALGRQVGPRLGGKAGRAGKAGVEGVLAGPFPIS